MTKPGGLQQSDAKKRRLALLQSHIGGQVQPSDSSSKAPSMFVQDPQTCAWTIMVRAHHGSHAGLPQHKSPRQAARQQGSPSQHCGQQDAAQRQVGLVQPENEPMMLPVGSVLGVPPYNSLDPAVTANQNIFLSRVRSSALLA